MNMNVTKGIYVAFVTKIMKTLNNFVIKDLYPDNVMVLLSLEKIIKVYRKYMAMNVWQKNCA